MKCKLCGSDIIYVISSKDVLFSTFYKDKEIEIYPGRLYFEICTNLDCEFRGKIVQESDINEKLLDE